MTGEYVLGLVSSRLSKCNQDMTLQFCCRVGCCLSLSIVFVREWLGHPCLFEVSRMQIKDAGDRILNSSGVKQIGSEYLQLTSCALLLISPSSSPTLMAGIRLLNQG